MNEQNRPAVGPSSPLPGETTASDGSPSRRVADALAPFEGAHWSRWYSQTDANIRGFAVAAIKRARAAGYESDIRTAARLADRMFRLGWECVWCGGPFQSIDHVMPLSLGGRDLLGNLVPACRICNSLKGGLHPSDWLAGKTVVSGCGTWSAHRRHVRAGEKCETYRLAVAKMSRDSHDALKARRKAMTQDANRAAAERRAAR